MTAASPFFKLPQQEALCTYEGHADTVLFYLLALCVSCLSNETVSQVIRNTAEQWQPDTGHFMC